MTNLLRRHRSEKFLGRRSVRRADLTRSAATVNLPRRCTAGRCDYQPTPPAGRSARRQDPGVEEGMVVLGPSPLVVPMVEEHQESHLLGDDVVWYAARPQFRAVPRQELVPLVPATTKCHASATSDAAELVSLRLRSPSRAPDLTTPPVLR